MSRRAFRRIRSLAAAKRDKAIQKATKRAELAEWAAEIQAEADQDLSPLELLVRMRECRGLVGAPVDLVHRASSFNCKPRPF